MPTINQLIRIERKKVVKRKLKTIDVILPWPLYKLYVIKPNTHTQEF